MARQPHLRQPITGLTRRQHTTETAPAQSQKGTRLSGPWHWPPRLIPAVWPGSDELLLIVALDRHPGSNDPTSVATMPELFKLGLWDSDHLAVPRLPEVAVRRGRASLHLTIAGRPWGGCSAPGGTEWASTGTCLVGVIEGIGHLRGQQAADAFITHLQNQQAVIAAATVSGDPFTIHIARVHRNYGCGKLLSRNDTSAEGAP